MKTKTLPKKPVKDLEVPQEVPQAAPFKVKIDKTRWLNPEADYSEKICIKSIELTDAYTRIDFWYKAPDYYISGGWIQIDPLSYIRPSGSNMRYSLFKAINIPLAPEKFYFRRCGQLHSYSLYFPALPKDTQTIDIIEREAPGTYFNFYGVKYQEWIQMANQVNVEISKN